MKRFEYYVCKSFSHFSEEYRLNELGKEGWELIKIDDDRMYFKREITGDRLAKLDAEYEVREAERKAVLAAEEAKDAEINAKRRELERANQYVENLPNSLRTSEHYAYIAALKRDEITFDEFKAKIDASLNQQI